MIPDVVIRVVFYPLLFLGTWILIDVLYDFFFRRRK